MDTNKFQLWYVTPPIRKSMAKGIISQAIPKQINKITFFKIFSNSTKNY